MLSERRIWMLDRLRREWAYLHGLVRTLRCVRPIVRNRNRTLADHVEDLAARHKNRLALVSASERLTYTELNARANRYAHWALSKGFGKSDVIALLMPNRPEYLCVWFGFAKVGAVTALLNTNLGGVSLVHCILVAKAKALVVDSVLLESVLAIRDALPRDIAIFVHGEAGTDLPRIDLALAHMPDHDLSPAERPKLTSADHCLYVYTSGTTGLPKAANINHHRVQLIMFGFAGATGAGRDDCLYDCLPMYHTVGGVCAPGAAFHKGGTLFIRDKFSARVFWSDIVRYRCTIFCYVGELCRYLLAAPPNPEEARHALRLCFGNGLRPDIFTPFRDRFGLPKILEFYAATEGNVTLFNMDSRPGAIGRIPPWLAHKFPVAVVRHDHETGMAMRGPDGFCLACAPNEAGEAIGEIVDDPEKPGNRFEGYADLKATEHKILRSVFRAGDAWFSTGDLMRRDELGYFYFLDRMGDTFRWKGENVSTAEVTEAVVRFAGVLDAAIYGVAIAGMEGRAGMAAIVARDPESFDLAAFAAHISASLPAYARPLFLRFQSEIDMTSTFKQRKLDLVAEGFDPGRVLGGVFFRDSEKNNFVRLDAQLYARIASGAFKL